MTIARLCMEMQEHARYLGKPNEEERQMIFAAIQRAIREIDQDKPQFSKINQELWENLCKEVGLR